MKKALVSLVIFVALVMVSSVCFAGEASYPLKTGTAEIGINNGDFLVGYFVTDELEVTGMADLTFGDTDVISFAVGGRFHMDADMGNIVPFAEAAIGFADESTDDVDKTTLFFTVGGGIKYFLVKSVSANVGAKILYTNVDVEGESDSNTDFTITAGLSAYIF